MRLMPCLLQRHVRDDGLRELELLALGSTLGLVARRVGVGSHRLDLGRLMQ
jgi:hypothetical protein